MIVKEHHYPELDVGEFLAWKDMGAYTISGAVAFNGIPLAKCIYTASTSWDTIKDAFVDTDDHISNLLKEAPVNSSTCAALFACNKLSLQQKDKRKDSESITDVLV